MKLRKKYIPLLLGLAAGLGILLGGRLNFSNRSMQLFSANKKKEKLNRLIDYIDFEYVDDVNTDSIVEVTVNSILDNLDPHSIYIPSDELQQVTESMQGDFIGIGVSYEIYLDTIAVVSTIQGGPSAQSGILPGDRILIADKDTLYGEKLASENLVSKLKGAENSTVLLQCFRPNKGLFEVRIQRGKVPLQSVDASFMISDVIGYVKINRFAETTYDEFKAALEKLKIEGMTQIVLDLRGNGGGFVSPALRIADEFLDGQKLIMFTKNKKGTIENSYATDEGSFEQGQVYVLQNEHTASASEILSGALQDNDRAIIVGRRSYGKGLVQREMDLGDGSAIRLTVSRYYTPTGRSIQRPYGNGNEAYFNDYLERYKNGELQSLDSIKVADSLQFKTLKGRVVYGGGGIIPDVFVAKNTTRVSEILNFALRSRVLDKFVFREMDRDRSFYNELTPESFKEFKIDRKMLNRFVLFCKEFNLEIGNFNKDKKVAQHLKAVMARQLFGSSDYESIISRYDPMIDKIIRKHSSVLF